MQTLDSTAAAVTRNPRRWLVLAVLCLSSLVLVIDNMVLTVAIPQISTSLHAGAQQIQWVIDAYLLVFAGLLLTSGSLSDRFGRRLVMIIGLVLFGAASLLAAYASSPDLLIASRAAMAVGGVLILPSTLSILITVFDEQERPKAISAWTAVSVLGMVGGPALGGVLLAHFWWGAVFVLNVPIAVVAIVAALVFMPESKGPARPLDVPGMVTSIVGVTALVWTIIGVPQYGWTGAQTLSAAAVAVIALGAFAVRELTTDVPMIPLHLFRNRTFTGSSFSLVLASFANAGLALVLTQYLQFVLGYTPMRTALAFTPLAIAALVCNGAGAALVNKFGARAMAVIGLAVVAVGFAVLAVLSAGSGFWLPALAMALIGAGAGLAMPAAVGALMSAVPAEHAGVGSALNDTIQQTGGALGVAVLGAVLAGTYTGAMPHSAPAAARQSIAGAVGNVNVFGLARDAFVTAMHVTFGVGAVCSLAAAVVAFFLMRGTGTVAAQEDSAQEEELVRTH
ncbi:DHA2 family multidrug resistance protein-like MFS transporter [Nocardia sp. GAS34]|uniref:MFS transporter n=1 Tax=unclassified Nocardia TaxID=2637762 RepID=UPI003D1AF6F3